MKRNVCVCVCVCVLSHWLAVLLVADARPSSADRKWLWSTSCSCQVTGDWLVPHSNQIHTHTHQLKIKSQKSGGYLTSLRALPRSFLFFYCLSMLKFVTDNTVALLSIGRTCHLSTETLSWLFEPCALSRDHYKETHSIYIAQMTFAW